jgi:hypothetical protein
MNALLEQITAIAPDQLRDFITAGAQDITDDMSRAMTEAVLQETGAKFTLGFKISVNLDKNVFDCDLSWALKKHLTSSHQIEDPAQVKLPLNN